MAKDKDTETANDTTLKELHGSNLPSAAPTAPAADSHNDITVNDPQLLRPVELPLVITPTSGAWANDEQTEYAKILNAAAYANPERWALDRDVEVARLKEIGANPSAYYKYTGTQPGPNNLSFKTKLSTNE